MKHILIVISLVVLIGCQNTENTSSKTDQGQPLTTLEKLTKEVEENPLDPDVYIRRAGYFLNNNQSNAAERDLISAIKIDSTLTEPFLQLADISFKRNNTSATKDYLFKLLNNDSIHIEGNLKLAELFLYVGSYEETIRYVNVALRQDETRAKAYFLKGMAYKYANNMKLAKSSFQTTVEQDPDYYNAHIQLALLYAQENNPIAVQYFQNALDITPASVEAWYGLGYFFQLNNDTTRAISAYENIRKLDPEHTDALYNLGYISLHMQNDVEKARDYFQEILKIRRSHSKALYMVGRTYEIQGEKEKAISYYKESSSNNPAFELPVEGLKRLNK